MASKIVVRHGKTKTKVYRAWRDILSRCRLPHRPDYERYGGRGIECRFASFEEFYAEVGDPPGPEYQIDRVNNDGHYEVGNMRWATRIEQLNNRRPSRPYRTTVLTYEGKTKLISAWAKEFGLNPNTLRIRIQRGWKIDDALRIPILRRNQRRTNYR